MKANGKLKKLVVGSVAFISICGMLLLWNSCKKEEASPSPSSSSMTLSMTDAPAAYDAVNIHIVKVEAKIVGLGESDEVAEHSLSEAINAGTDNDVDFDVNHDGISDDMETEVHDGDHDSHWFTLNAFTGFYDLLKLRNNVAVVLAKTRGLPVGKVTQLRLILGTGNNVVVNGITYPLTVPGGFSTGIKILVREVLNLNSSDLSIVLDFNADKSIVQNDDGKYILKPVIKIVK